jgi:hypothetical protein
MANPALTVKTLRGYAADVARMARQLENSGHHEEAKAAREFYRLLARLLADRQADELVDE